MGDAVDELLERCGREWPGLDVWPVGVVERVTRLALLFERELRGFFAGYGLERWEFDVLAALRGAGPPYELTAGALNRAALVTSGAVTNRIDRLAAKELVERVRSVADRRSVRVRLTEQGWALVEELLPLSLVVKARLLEPLGPRERRRLADELRGLLESLGDTSPG